MTYQKHSRANFLYKIGTFEDTKVLLIWDKDQGSISVTNDIENVVADIAAHENIAPSDYLILYRDSMARWDGWDAATETFFAIGPQSMKQIENKFKLNNEKDIQI